MTDLARLAISIESDGATRAANDLQGLERQSKRTERATEDLGGRARNTRTQVVGMGGGARGAANDLDRLALGSSSLNNSLAVLGRQVLAVGGVLAAGFGINQATQAAREFDAALAEVSTLLPRVAGEIDVIEASSRRLAVQFGGSATSQAQAFYQAISAGAGDAAASTELLEVANRTAIGGVTDVTTAVDVLTTAVNAYASENLSAADAADILFVGMRAGKTTITELASTLGRAIPAATALGVSFEEVVAGVSALTTQGQSTELAVTGITAAMSQLLNPSEQARELAGELGLEFNAAAVEAHGLAGFMEEVVRATDGNQEAMAQLFGSVEALRAVFSLAGSGGERFSEILEQMEDRAGAADQAFDRVSSSVSQRLNVALADLGERGNEFGGVLLNVGVPALESTLDFVDQVEVAVRRLNGTLNEAPIDQLERLGDEAERLAERGNSIETAFAFLTREFGEAQLGTVSAVVQTDQALQNLTRTAIVAAAELLNVEFATERNAQAQAEALRQFEIDRRMDAYAVSSSNARDAVADATAATEDSADANAAASASAAGLTKDQRELREEVARSTEELLRLEAANQISAKAYDEVRAAIARENEVLGVGLSLSSRMGQALLEELERRDELQAAIERMNAVREQGIAQEISDLRRLEAANEISEASYDRVAQAIARENEVREAGLRLSSEAGQAMLEELARRDEIKNSIDETTQSREREIDALEEFEREQRRTMRAAEREVARASEKISGVIAEGMIDGFDDVLPTIERMLVNWAADMILQPIIQPMVAGGMGGGGGFGMPGMGGMPGQGGLGGIGGGGGGFSLANIWSNYVGSTNALGNQVGSVFGRGASMLGASSGVQAGLANIGQNLGASAPTSFITGQVLDQFGLEGAGGFGQTAADMVLATIGQAIGGPVGAAIATVISRIGGELLQDKDYPYARSDIAIRNGRAVVTGSETLDGADSAAINQLGQGVAEAINAGLRGLGVGADFTGGGTTIGSASGRSRALGSGFFAGADGGFSTGATFTGVKNPEEAASRAVAFALSQAIAGGAVDLPEEFAKSFDEVFAVFERNAFEIDQAIADINFAQGFEDALASLEGSTETFGDSIRANISAQIEQTLVPLRQFRDRTEELGLSSERSDAALKSFVEGLLGLREGESLNQAEAAIEAINAKFDALAVAATEFGVSLERVEIGRQQALADLEAGFLDSLRQQVRELSGRGYLSDAEGVVDRFRAGRDQAQTLGVDPTLLVRRALLELQEVASRLGENELRDLASSLDNLPPELQGARAAILDYADALSQSGGAARSAAEAMRAELAFREANQALAETAYQSEADRLAQMHAQEARHLDERRRLLEQEAEVLRRAGQQAMDLARGLSFSSSSPVSLTDQFAEAQSNFAQTLAAARAGDTDAVGRLTGDAQTLLQLNAQVNRSGTAGASLFESVRSALEEVGADALASGDARSQQAASLRMQERQTGLLESQLDTLAETLGINRDGFDDVREAIRDSARQAVESGKSLDEFLQANAAVFDVLTGAGFDAGEFAQEAFAEALAVIDTTVEEAASGIEASFAQLLASLAGGEEGMSGAFDSAAQEIANGGSSVGSALAGAAGAIDSATGAAISAINTAADDAARSAAQSINNTVNDAIRDFSPMYPQPVAQPIPAIFNDATGQFEDLTREVRLLREENARDAEQGNRIAARTLDQLAEQPRAGGGGRPSDTGLNRYSA